MVIRLALPTAPRAALLGALLAFATPFAAQPALAKQAVIPLHVERGPRGDPHLGIDVGLGTRTVRLELSTATPGMRMIASAVPPGAVERTGAPAGGTLVSGLVVKGEQARARLTFPGADGSVPALINVINTLACSETVPDCPAAHGRTPEAFGGLFPGVLGIGNVGPPAERCCANPFDSFGWYRQRYIVHSALDAPSIALDPDDASLRGFTPVDITGAETPIGCVRLAGGATNEICGPIVFETAVSPLVVTTTGALTATPLPPGTTATLSVGAWSRTHAIGPNTGLHLVMRSGMENRIVVGLQALQSVDLFYDVTNERIASASR